MNWQQNQNHNQIKKKSQNYQFTKNPLTYTFNSHNHVQTKNSHLPLTFQSKQQHESHEILEPFLQNLRKKPKPRSSIPIDYHHNDLQLNESSVSISKISEHYKQIQAILESENSNLKEHNEYLVQVISSMQERERNYKLKLRKYKERMHQLEKDREIKNIELRQMNKLLNKMELFISNLDQQHREEEENKKIKNYQNNFNGLQSPTFPSHSAIKQQESISNLHDKFDSLIYEYKKTNNPEIRKECIKFLKELKEKKQGDSQMQSKFRKGSRQNKQKYL